MIARLRRRLTLLVIAVLVLVTGGIANMQSRPRVGVLALME